MADRRDEVVCNVRRLTEACVTRRLAGDDLAALVVATALAEIARTPPPPTKLLLKLLTITDVATTILKMASFAVLKPLCPSRLSFYRCCLEPDRE